MLGPLFAESPNSSCICFLALYATLHLKSRAKLHSSSTEAQSRSKELKAPIYRPVPAPLTLHANICRTRPTHMGYCPTLRLMLAPSFGCAGLKQGSDHAKKPPPIPIQARCPRETVRRTHCGTPRAVDEIPASTGNVYSMAWSTRYSQS